VLSASIILLRWKRGCSFGTFDGLLATVPFLIVEELWRALPSNGQRWDWAFVLGVAMQVRMASVVFYCALALGTRCSRFYAGLAAPFAVPFMIYGWREREIIPNFRAVAAACLGFVTLAMGMVVSLFRERLMRWLSTERVVREKVG